MAQVAKVWRKAVGVHLEHPSLAAQAPEELLEAVGLKGDAWSESVASAYGEEEGA